MVVRRSVMTLYTANTCPYCHRVRIVLAEKGITFETEEVNLDDKPEELKELNPYETVPTLVDRDLVLFESSIIMEYLDERFPHPPLMPVDPVSRARTRLFMHRVDRDWFAPVADLESDDAARMAPARKALLEQLTLASPIFAQKPYFMSDEFTLVDCCIAPLLWRLPKWGIDLPPQARPLEEYAQRLFERDGLRAALTDEEKEMRR
jgi:RNA polymerase-associated protein